MIATMDSKEARTRFRDILDATIAGKEVVIERYNKPTAVVVNYDAWRNMADELARLRRIVKADKLLVEMKAGDYIDLKDLDAALAAD